MSLLFTYLCLFFRLSYRAPEVTDIFQPGSQVTAATAIISFSSSLSCIFPLPFDYRVLRAVKPHESYIDVSFTFS